MLCWRAWSGSHNADPGQARSGIGSSRSPVILPVSVSGCRIGGGLPRVRPRTTCPRLPVQWSSPRDGVPSPPAAPHSDGYFGSNNAAVVTSSLLRSHDARDGQCEPGIFPGFDSQLPATGGGDLVDSGSPVVRGNAPFALNPAIELQSLQSGVERAFLDQELVIGRLLKELHDAVSVKIAPR